MDYDVSFWEMLLPILVPLIVFGLPLLSVVGFVLFLVFYFDRKKRNAFLPPEAQKSTLGLKLGFIICGAIALTVIVLFIVLVTMVNTGAIQLM